MKRVRGMKSWRKHPVMRRAALVMVFSMASLEVVPPGVFADPPPPPNLNWQLPAGHYQALTPEQARKIEAHRSSTQPDVQPLSEKALKQIRGRGPYRNKYLAGTFPWHRSLRDANLCTGNLFKSFTDIQVSPAKGAGLALQRTYNSMDDRVGPFGLGWTHAYDIFMHEETGGDYSDRSDFFAGKHKYPPLFANTYANNLNGNTLSGGGRADTWDSANRLVSCTYGGSTAAYVYGADGLRHRATANGTTTTSSWMGSSQCGS